MIPRARDESAPSIHPSETFYSIGVGIGAALLVDFLYEHSFLYIPHEDPLHARGYKQRAFWVEEERVYAPVVPIQTLFQRESGLVVASDEDATVLRHISQLSPVRRPGDGRVVLHSHRRHCSRAFFISPYMSHVYAVF